MDETRGYLEFELTSIYGYATEVLKLSNDIAYNLIALARKSRDVPALKEAIRSGSTTSSKARKVISVISKENQAAWLSLLSKASAREIEKEVARVNSKAITPEIMTYASVDRLIVRLGVSEELAKRLERIKDLESQKTGRSVSLEQALEAMAEAYLEKHDPVRRALRAARRNQKVADAEMCEDKDGSILSKNLCTMETNLKKAQSRDARPMEGQSVEGQSVESQSMKVAAEIFVTGRDHNSDGAEALSDSLGQSEIPKSIVSEAHTGKAAARRIQSEKETGIGS